MIESTDYSKLISAIAAIISAIIAIINFRSASRRVKLKDDLEILKRIKEFAGNDAHSFNDISDYIEDKVKKRLNKIYVYKGIDGSDTFSSLLLFILAVFPWSQSPKSTIYEYRSLFFLIFFAMSGWFLYSAFKKRNLQKPAPGKMEKPKDD